MMESISGCTVSSVGSGRRPSVAELVAQRAGGGGGGCNLRRRHDTVQHRGQFASPSAPPHSPQPAARSPQPRSALLTQQPGRETFRYRLT